jgi:hypothetical protein
VTGKEFTMRSRAAGRRRGARSRPRAAGLGVVLLLAAADPARAESFTIDDSPAAPAVGSVGPIPGCGAENQFGRATPSCPTGLAPSPTLSSLMPLRGSGSILAPGPSVLLSPNGDSLDALSSNHADLSGESFLLSFSVDRLSSGAAGSAVAVQVGLNQQPADLFWTTHVFRDPGSFAGSLGTGPFAGTLSGVGYGVRSNGLLVDDSVLGLLAGGGVVAPTAAAPPIGVASHDNVDAYDDADLDANADGLFDAFAYFSINPDEGILVERSPADLFDVAPNTAAASPTPFASAASMGLDSGGAGSDSIDALVVFDHGDLGGPGNAGPGGQSGVDYALFSLAPGSASLAVFSLSAADVLFSDFSGAFAVYATAADLGLVGSAGGTPGAGDNLDALEIMRPPPAIPAVPPLGRSLLAAALVVAGLAAASRRPPRRQWRARWPRRSLGTLWARPPGAPSAPRGR